MSKNRDNKVKFNIKNAHYAKQNEAEDGTITFETPVPVKGAVSVSFDANGDISKFYADGILYYVSAANNGYEGDAEFALIPDEFREDILKEQRDEKDVLHEVSDSGDTQKFAFLFEFDGDQKATRRVLYNNRIRDKRRECRTGNRDNYDQQQSAGKWPRKSSDNR